MKRRRGRTTGKLMKDDQSLETVLDNIIGRLMFEWQGIGHFAGMLK